jgi:hypothetical protein
VSARRIRDALFYLAKDPLPFRKLNYTRPGSDRCSLYEADDYVRGKLESWGYAVEREACLVQCFRRNPMKPKHHQYDTPHPHDPWWIAHNLYAKKAGSAYPDEIVLLIAHKDSQSWIDSPGANDNAIGTACNLELARVLADYPTQRSIWWLFCNEEHRPWTSVTAARNARMRGDDIIAVLNLDGPGTRSPADRKAGRMTNVSVYYAPEAERLADLMAEVNRDYRLGLVQSKHKVERPGNDDGSFIKEGYRTAVHNIGSWPYADPNYHLETEVPELVDVPNAAVTTQAILAAVLRIDQGWLLADAGGRT